MESHSLSPFFSFGFAVMLLLSITVYPVMAADASKQQMESFSIDDIQSVTLNELVSDQAGSGFTASASSADDFQESHLGKVNIRAKDPLANQHSPVLGEFSASSAETGDPVDAEMARAIVNLNQEGYVPTGQTEHQYESQFDSEKFRHIGRSQQNLLEAKGLHIDTLNPTALSTREDVAYYFFTNAVTNATRVISVVQMIGPEGNPVGERKMEVSPDLTDHDGDAASGDEFSGSMATETTALLGTAVATGWIPVWGWILIAVLVIVAIVLVIVIVVESGSDTPASPPSIKWQRAFGGSGYDWVRTGNPTPDGGSILTGFTTSLDGDLVNDSTMGKGMMDVWSIKMNKDHIIEWQSRNGGSDGDISNDIIPTFDSQNVLTGYAFVGTTRSNNEDGDVHGKHTGSLSDIWVGKYDPSGNLLWQRCIGGSDTSEGYGITQLLNGNLVVVGYTRAGDGDISRFHQVNHGEMDMLVALLDINGNLLDLKTYGGSDFDWAYKVKGTSDGGYIILGGSRSNDAGFGTMYGDSDIIVIKSQSDGTTQWVHHYGGSGYEQPGDIIEVPGTGFVFVGQSTSIDHDLNIGKLTQHGDGTTMDIWVVHIDKTGIIQRQKCYGGSSDDVSEHIQSTQDGGYIIAGSTMSNDGDVNGAHLKSYPTYDAWVLKTNSQGDIIFQKCLGGSATNSASSAFPNGDSYTVIANTVFNDGDVVGGGYHGDPPAMMADYWVVELGE